MKRTGKVGMMVLVMFLIGCIVFAGFAIQKDKKMVGSTRDEAYISALKTLLDIVGIDEEDSASVLAGRRLSQKLTVTTEDGVVTNGGTVTKIQDEFYPGSYKISFTNKTILTSRARVEVAIDVKKGDEVYILIGDKNSGYTEYATVTAKEENLVAFDTNILQDYTISTTDIKSAQEAMADIFASDMGN